MTCNVELLQGPNGETKRILLNGNPVPGLLKVQTSGGPRTASTVLITVHADSIRTVAEAG